MPAHTIILLDEYRRRMALRSVQLAPLGVEVVIRQRGRTVEQNKRIWSMMQAIVDAGAVFANREWAAEDWYELLASAYLREKGLETGTTIQGLAGEMLTLGRIRPSHFTTSQFSEFSDSVLAWMDNNGIPWGEPRS